MLSQFLRDAEKYKNIQGSQQQSLSQSLSQELTMSSSEDECKDISSAETTDYEASQMVFTQCVDKIPIVNETLVETNSKSSQLDVENDKNEPSKVDESHQDVTISTSMVNREVGIQCNLSKSATRNVLVQTDSIIISSDQDVKKNFTSRRRKIFLRIGLPKRLKNQN